MIDLRDTSLRELRRVFDEMQDQIDTLKNTVSVLEEQDIPDDKTAWTKQDLQDSAYNDLVVSPAAVKLPASSAPSWATWLTDLESLNFTDGDIVHFQGMQLPHSYVPGTDIYPHVHFFPTGAIADAESLNFTVTFTSAPVWGVFPATASATATFTNNAEARAKLPAAALSGTSIVANTHLIAAGATVDGSDLDLSGVVVGKLTYNDDTYNGAIGLVSADAHIRINRLGSRAEYTG